MRREAQTMRRTVPVTGWVVAMCAIPSVALAADGSDSTMLVDLFGAAVMVAAVALLIAALGLQRVARGSAIADNISYVVAGCLCLGASVLGDWVVRFVPEGLTSVQVALSSEVLTLVAIVLFCVYFMRVRAALRRFLNVAEAGEAELARAQAGEVRSAEVPTDGAASLGDESDG
jgi:hypothetical protein